MRSNLLLILLIPSLLAGGEGYFSPLYRWSGGILKGGIDTLKIPSISEEGKIIFFFEKGNPFLGYTHSGNKIIYSFWVGGHYASSTSEVVDNAGMPLDEGFLSVSNIRKARTGTIYGEGGVKVKFESGKVVPEIVVNYFYFSRDLDPSLKIQPPWNLNLPDPVTNDILYVDNGEESGIRKIPHKSGKVLIHNFSSTVGFFTFETLWIGFRFNWKRTIVKEDNGIDEYDTTLRYFSGSERYLRFNQFTYGINTIIAKKNFRIEGYIDYYPGYTMTDSFERWFYYYKQQIPSEYGNEYTLYNLTFEDNYSGTKEKGLSGQLILSARPCEIKGFTLFSGVSLFYSYLKGNYTKEGGFTEDSKIVHTTGETSVNQQANFLKRFYGERSYKINEVDEEFQFTIPFIFAGDLSLFKFHAGYIFLGRYHHYYSNSEITRFTTLKVEKISGGSTYSEQRGFIPQPYGKVVTYDFIFKDLFLGMIEYKRNDYFIRLWFSTDRENFLFFEAGMKL